MIQIWLNQMHGGCLGYGLLIYMNCFPYVSLTRASLVAQRVENLRSTWRAQVLSLGQKYPLEKEMATHSSILAWEIPWTKRPDGLQSMGSRRVGHDCATKTLTFIPVIKSKITVSFPLCCSVIEIAQGWKPHLLQFPTAGKFFTTGDASL